MNKRDKKYYVFFNFFGFVSVFILVVCSFCVVFFNSLDFLLSVFLSLISLLLCRQEQRYLIIKDKLQNIKGLLEDAL